jgi:hypothetical protein
MKTQQAYRLAVALIESNCDAPQFDVEVERDVVEPLRDALTQLGCKVKLDATRPRLHVSCPEKQGLDGR